MKIIFFGPPGSGKGTQAKLIADKLNILHLSTGDILRKKLDEGDTIALQLKEIMSSGNLVSDDLLNKIITEKLNSVDCSDGFILDGYPRTTPQADFLLSFMNDHKINLDYVFDFKIDFNEVTSRILKRSQLEKRSDDNIDIIQNRLDKYLKETQPVSESFGAKFTSIYNVIDASREISQIQKNLMKIIKKS